MQLSLLAMPSALMSLYTRTLNPTALAHPLMHSPTSARVPDSTSRSSSLASVDSISSPATKQPAAVTNARYSVGTRICGRQPARAACQGLVRSVNLARCWFVTNVPLLRGVHYADMHASHIDPVPHLRPQEASAPAELRVEDCTRRNSCSDSSHGSRTQQVQYMATRDGSRIPAAQRCSPAPALLHAFGENPGCAHL